MKKKSFTDPRRSCSERSDSFEYVLKPTAFFLGQLDKLSDDSKKLLSQKLMLLKENPFRFKRIKGYKLFLFRIRFEDNRREKRLLYLVDKPFVKVLCILDRKHEYSDLKMYLRKFT